MGAGDRRRRRYGGPSGPRTCRAARRTYGITAGQADAGKSQGIGPRGSHRLHKTLALSGGDGVSELNTPGRVRSSRARAPFPEIIEESHTYFHINHFKRHDMDSKMIVARYITQYHFLLLYISFKLTIALLDRITITFLKMPVKCA